MKSCALVTTPYAWCVPRSRSLLTTNSVWSTHTVVSGRTPSGVAASTKAGSMLPTAIACSAVATNTANVASAVTARDALARARHPQGRAEDRRLQIVDRDGVPAQQGPHVAVLDEPHHVFTRSRVHQRGTHDPHDPSAALLLFPEQLGEHRVVDWPLARHLGLHEPELVRAVPPAEEALGVDENAFAPILAGRHGDLVALAHFARLRRHEVAGGVLHDRAVHARQARPPPRAAHLHVGRQVAGGEKAVGEDAVGGGWVEARFGRLR